MRWGRFVRPTRGRVTALAALGVLVLAAGLAAPHVWARYHLRAARAEVARGHNAAAGLHLRSCRVVYPNHPEALLLAARVARRSGAWTDADGFLDRYWAAHGDDDALVFERLLLRATRGELEAATPLAARIEAGGPDARAARAAIVTGLLYRYRWAEAERHLTAWLAADPDDTAALQLQGQMYEQRGQTSSALLSFRRVVELDPDHDEARLRLATLLLQLRQGEEAVTHLGYLRTRLPANAEVYAQWVRALALQGRTEDARRELDRCLVEHPDFPAALAERGKFALADGDEAAAERYFGRAARFDPGDLPTRNQYALLLARNGKPAEAAAEQAAVRQLETDYERIGQLSRGALQTHPNDPAVLHEIGLIALRSGQTADALRWLTAALKADPDHAPSHAALAGYYQALGNPVLAAKHRAVAQQLRVKPAPKPAP